MPRFTRFLATSSILTATMASLSAHAGAAYESVWYPDGKIRWCNVGIDNGNAGIKNAMKYLGDHTPLDIAEVSESSQYLNLRFQKNILIPANTCWTNGYWDEARPDWNKMIECSPYTEGKVGMYQILHESMHALGFPHEFQRDDRDFYVNVCDTEFFNDTFNYAKMGSLFWPDAHNNLSPYDFGSLMNDGYQGCVEPLSGSWDDTSRVYRGEFSPMSVHDINSIYRVYADGLGLDGDGDRFGHAVATGDFDDDGFEDVAVASMDPVSGGYQPSVFFFRGVGVDPAYNDPGSRYIPWFRKTFSVTADPDAHLVLASGDFNGDKIVDLAVGQPYYGNNEGRVEVLFVNSGPDDPDKPDANWAPWGLKGIRASHLITPLSVGLPGAAARFGASLAAARLTADAESSRADLIIGAPGASLLMKAIGAVVIVQGTAADAVDDWTVGDIKHVWNPTGPISSSAGGEFGFAVSALPGICANGASAADNNDGFIVGAPGAASNAGAVHVYGCAVASPSSLVKPALLKTVTHSQAGARYGAAAAGFRRRMSAASATYKYYAAIGAPEYTGTSPDPKSGIVYLDEYTSAGVKTFVNAYRPSTRSNNDEFGHAIAVQQVRLAGTEDAGLETYIAIGMPGTEVDGKPAGKVYVWRPWNSDGSVNGSAKVISALAPTSSSATRFGSALATLSNLRSHGGFVAGAPESVEIDYGAMAGYANVPIGTVTPGSADVLLNNASGDWSWSTWRQHLTEETEGDQRPAN